MRVVIELKRGEVGEVGGVAVEGGGGAALRLVGEADEDEAAPQRHRHAIERVVGLVETSGQ